MLAVLTEAPFFLFFHLPLSFQQIKFLASPIVRVFTVVFSRKKRAKP
ncbi:hypothetical protein B4168_4000 [Anoxybacillus flavithermus]|nr:hypothetical protein B4168_4000 [Anoxybacillus flavithermus]OAO87622.1 hypothetical protein GT23_1271 [Parageobacillus thermoglucosidasius]